MSGQRWQLPPIEDILDTPLTRTQPANVLRQKNVIEKTLAELGFEAQVQQVQQGPRFTRFNLLSGEQLSRLKSLDKDLSVALSGAAVQIVLPTPHHPHLSILVARANRQNSPVKLRQMLESAEYGSHPGPLKFGLGLDIVGKPIAVGLPDMPHLLIGGTTGSGKSMCLHAIIAGFLCTYPPNALQLLLIDPLNIELRDYNNLPHLFAPVVTRSAQALDTLGTVDNVIDRRYKIFSQHHARDIISYNQKLADTGQDTIPYIVVAIDNVFDLLMTSAGEVEQIITRMAQRARGAGVHLILSTPRADTTALSGTLKANFPGRIAFRVMGPAESRLILDQAGAEELLGQGDMLFKAPHTTEPQRIQGIYVSELERRRIVEFWRS